MDETKQDIPLLHAHLGGHAGYKTYRVGTHRTVPPAETIARVSPFMKEMGITRIANVTGLDRIGIPVVMVCRPNSRSVAVSQGKGLNLDAAKASGLMESVETYHAERIALPLKLGSYDDLRGSHHCVNVDALPKRQGGRFHSNLPMLWIEGLNLFTDRPVWLPYEMVHTNYTYPLPPGHGCFPASSNGLASGNHMLEAVCHAICEVIERDSTAVWHQLDKAQRNGTRVDLNTVGDETCRAVLERLQQAEVNVVVWDTTTNIGVPSFYCMVTEDNRDSWHFGVGAGCYPCTHIALLRAITEAVQVRTTYIAGSRDDLTREEFTAGGMADKQRYAQGLMRLKGVMREFGAVPNRIAETFEDDVAWLLDRLGSAGIQQVVVVDLQKPQYHIPVVRVVIPGLEAPHDDDDYVPGNRARAAREGRLWTHT